MAKLPLIPAAPQAGFGGGRGKEGPFPPGQNSQTGEVFRRGPDLKHRAIRKDIVRLLLAHALAMAQTRKSKLVPHAAAGDAVLVLAKLLRGQKIPNTRGFLGVMER